MFDNIKKFSAYQTIFSAFSLVGASFAYTVFSIYNFGTISTTITTTINWCFDLIFNSLGLLGFFIRPTTIKIVVELFSTYWLLRFSFKSMVVFCKLAKFLFNYVSSLLGKITSGILAIFGL